MATYTHEYSSFPDSLYTRTHYLDANDIIGALITQIRTLQAEGKYTEAQQLITENKTTLKRYLLTTEAINAIEEETRNLEIYAKGHMQSIYYGSEPEVAFNDDVWIGGNL